MDMVQSRISYGSLQFVFRAAYRIMLAIIILFNNSMFMTWHLLSVGESPAVEQCDETGCTINNAYGVWNDRSTCKGALVVYPTTEQEILSIIASAVHAKKKIKVVTSSSHSIPKLACPGSSVGLILSTKNYSSILNIDTQMHTVTAQGGIGLRTLIDAIASKGLALRVSPYWDNITLAGLLSTSSHGSSNFDLGGAVHEYVTSMRLITPASANEGYAIVRILNQGDIDLNSAKVSLGVLGVVSTVTLQLEATFKRNVTLDVVHGEDGLEDEIFHIAKNVEFGDVTWYPGLHQVVYRYDHRVPMDSPGEGKNKFLGFQPQVAVLPTAFRAFEELADATNNRQLKCDLAFSLVSSLQFQGYGFYQNGDFFTSFPVTGHHHLIMATSGCQRSFFPYFSCPWDPRIPGLFFYEASATLPLNKLRPFLTDAKLLRNATPNCLCDLDLYTGILIRFVKKSSGAYLGTAQIEDSVMLDFTFSRGNVARIPRLDGDVFQELEQMLFWKYEATPHWGKNRNYVFEGVGRKYKDLARFLDTKRKFDPNGLFSNDWSDAILGIGNKTVVVDAPYCAIEGLCRCWKDEHCAPEKKSFCRSGRIYKDARVCRTEV